MRTMDVGRSVVSGCVVYVAMAACSGSTGDMTKGSLDGGSSEPTVDATDSTDAPSLLDAIVNPVPDANAETTTNGSRLKAMYRVGEDGSRQLLSSWHDSTRNEDCTFSFAADGFTRCLPSGLNTTAGSYFADAACTKGVAYAGNPICVPGTAPAYALVIAAATCTVAGGYRVFALSSSYTSAGAYTRSGSSCVATPFPAGSLFFNIGAEVDLASFVKSSVVIEP
jgi:hypothetical protein